MADDKRTEVFRDLTPQALSQARNLLQTARHAALATLAPEDGHPMVSRVGLAAMPNGTPVTLVSDLAAHTAALAADSRCSLLVGEPGKGDPLAHPRLMLRCRAEKIVRGGPLEDSARAVYLAVHPKAGLYAGFADFHFVLLVPVAGVFNAGFGKAYRLTAADLTAS